MANQSPPLDSNPTSKMKDKRNHAELEAEEDDSELDKLEEEVNEMAQKLLHYRSTFPDQLQTTLVSVLEIERPELPVFDRGSEPVASSTPAEPGARSSCESDGGALLDVNDQETADKVQSLKDRISSNASAIPIVLKRMNDCVSRIDTLISFNDIIHPVFKRKKT